MVINVFGGNETYINASKLRGLHLVKNLTPLWASHVRKRVRATMHELISSDEGSVITYESALQKYHYSCLGT
jgi:hypothetical protein